MTFDRYSDVQAALADPHLVPLPAEPGTSGTMTWLRATVARFSAGDTHARRRAMVEADLARLDPDALRTAAAASPDGDVVKVLAEALGLPESDAVAEAIGVVATYYFGGDPDAAADDAVAWLLSIMDGDDAEVAANRIGLLVQARNATHDLIENTRRHPSRDLETTLRYDSPVQTMRRVAVSDTQIAGVDIAAGELVVLDIAAANVDTPDQPLLTFGSPPRVCPGREHAMALAAGVLSGDSEVLAMGITSMVEHTLALAATWTAWDGKPIPADDRIYTPHKAIRREADHLIDHLAEMEARLAGEEPMPDAWYASAITTEADLAPFTEQDLAEARSRLQRLARIWTVRLNSLTAEQLDNSPGTGWSFRKIAVHLSSTYYADAVGDLS